MRFTPKGESLLPIARAEEQQVERQWERHLGSRRMRELHRSLTLLREITDPYREADD